MKKTFLYVGFACLGILMGTVSSIAQAVGKAQSNPESNRVASPTPKATIAKDDASGMKTTSSSQRTDKPAQTEVKPASDAKSTTTAQPASGRASKEVKAEQPASSQDARRSSTPAASPAPAATTNKAK